MFRSEPAARFELVKKIINGVEQTILVVKLKLRPPRTVGAFDIRRDRLRAAEMRLGMWENRRFVGHGLAELVGKARHGKPLTRDERIVMHAGFSNPGELQSF